MQYARELLARYLSYGNLDRRVIGGKILDVLIAQALGDGLHRGVGAVLVAVGVKRRDDVILILVAYFRHAIHFRKRRAVSGDAMASDAHRILLRTLFRISGGKAVARWQQNRSHADARDERNDFQNSLSVVVVVLLGDMASECA